MEESIKYLYELATRIRRERLEKGCCVFPKDKYFFKIESDCTVDSYSLEQKIASKYLVEEFMLIANQLTATFIT